jgi:colanic acid/amylovoran biosynthesis glycosyltransferase
MSSNNMSENSDSSFDSKKPVVLVFAEKLLPISETFIVAQTQYLAMFKPRLIGLGRVSPSLPIPSDSILMTQSINTRTAVGQKLYRRTGLAPAFHSSVAAAVPRLIHAHFASGGAAALSLVRNLGVPLVVTLHGSDVTTRVDFRSRYRDLWRVASSFICVSEFIRTKALEAGFPKEKLVKHFIGIDLADFRPSDQGRDPNLVLFVGRLVEKKGCAHLLQAMSIVQRRHPEARAVIIGDGPLRNSLERLAKQLSVTCEFLGPQPSSTVRDWMSRARVFCVPSVTAASGDSEGLGMVFGEAQAMGTPVVSFHHGGIPEVVLHGQTGLLAPEKDERTLAQSITQMLEDEACWQKFSESAIASMRETFDLKSQTRLLEDIYSDVCGPTSQLMALSTDSHAV